MNFLTRLVLVMAVSLLILRLYRHSKTDVQQIRDPVKVAFLVSSNDSNLEAILKYFQKVEKQGIIKPCVIISNKENVSGLPEGGGDVPVAYVPSEIQKGMSWEEKNPLRAKHAQDLISCLEKYGVTPENGLICCCGFRLLLHKDLLDHYPNQVISLHPSLLPAFPGLDVIEKALERGVKVTGVTVYFIDEGMDTGPIIAQKVVSVTSADTVETLKEKVYRAGSQLYPLVIEKIACHKVKIEDRRDMKLSSRLVIFEK